MTTLNLDESYVSENNPVDTIEGLAAANDWGVDRQGDDEITLVVKGNYCDFQLRFFWRTELSTLQFACMFDMRIPDKRLIDVYHTIGLINERMWIGHFDYWSDEGALMFRHASLGDKGDLAMSEDHLATLIETALGECERFYPVVQFVLWGNKTPNDAIEAAMLECVGSA